MFNNKINGKERNNDQQRYFVNETIRADSLLVIGDNGENFGIMSKRDAIFKARALELDLVQVGEKDGKIVAKIMDFGKFLYMKKKQLNEARKHQKVILIKELKFRPYIGDQDYKTKLNQAEQFFKEDKKVKFTLQFKGREIATMDEVGARFFTRINNDLTERKVGTILEEKESKGNGLWSKIYSVKR
jgi:translation initiation factor IF-3